MKILMVTSSYPKFPGDVTAPFIESIVLGLLERGHQVDLVLPHHPRLEQPDRPGLRIVTYRYAPTDGLCLWGYAQSLESDVRIRRRVKLLVPWVALSLRRCISGLLADNRYDVGHVHWVVPNGILVADVLRAHRVPLVVSLHGSDVFVAERMRLVSPLVRRTFAASGAITACSADLHVRALGLGAPAVRTRTLPYGVDVHAFSPELRTGAARERLGVGPEAFLVLALGRLVEKKGFTYLVEAAARTGGIQVVLVGDGDLRQSLEAQARESHAPIRFSGFLDRETVAAALASADVVVVPSVVDRAGNVDGLPNVLLEALAAGRAVIATRVAGIPDVVRHDDNGLLVPEKDATALAAALRRLVREPDTRARLGAAARRTALERLSWEATARAFEDCYVQATALDAR
jgi:glycosyltransferase involved in cell wall biosynthesis